MPIRRLGRVSLALALALVLLSCVNRALTMATPTPTESAASASSPIPTYALALTLSGPGAVSGGGGITCATTCITNLPGGTTVSLSATPETGSVFLGWSGACTGAATTCVVSLSAAASVEARFGASSYPLTISRSGPGLVASEPIGLSCGDLCAATFPTLTAVALTAFPGPGATFVGWSGACDALAVVTCVVTVDAARSITARFSGTFDVKIARAGPGVVTSAPPGISCGVDCTARFATGTSLTLTATAEPGASFAEWSGDCTGTAPVCAIAVDAAKNVTARFDAPLGSAALTVSRRGPGAVTSTPPGLTCGAACSATFITGTDVTLNAVAEPGALFDGWGGDCSGTASTCTVTMSAARTATARFLLSSYALAVTRSGPGTVTSAPDGISCGTTCTATFASGSTVMLAATANATALFSGWGGACSGTAPTCTVTMDASRSVTASFAGVTNVVSITRSGPGTVTSAPAGIDCGVVCSARFVSGARVTLTAVPDAGSLFGGWSGDCVGASATCTLTVDRAINAAVRFAQSSYLLSVNKSGSGTGKVTSSPPGIDCGPTCLASFDNGTAVTLVARADAGMQFTGWSGGCSGITDSCVLTMDVPGSVTATFMRTFALTVVVRPTSGGIVVIGPAGSSCTQVCTVNFADGTPITLTARPLTGGQLVGWDGGPCSPLGAALTCQFALTASQSVIATFSNIR